MTACRECGAPLAAEGTICARCAEAASTSDIPLPATPRRRRGRGRRAGAVLVVVLAASAVLALWAVPAQGRRDAHSGPAPVPTLSLSAWQQQANLLLTYAVVAAHPNRYVGAKIMWECQISTPLMRDPSTAARRDATCQVYATGGTGAGGEVMLRLAAGSIDDAVVGATVIVFGTVARPVHIPGGATSGDTWIDVAYLVPDQFGGD